MFAVFLYYTRTQWRNRTRQWLSRLRSPRYAAAFVIGIAYFFFALGGPGLFQPHISAERRIASSHMISVLGPVYLALVLALAWLGGASKFALSFTPAEANLLVPAPLTRRQLLNFKLLSVQVPLLFSAFFISFVMRTSAQSWGQRYIGAWLLVTTLHLHQVAASMVRDTVSGQGRAGWRRMWPVLLVLALAVGAILVSVFRSVPTFRSAGADVGGIGHALGQILTQPPASYAVYPLRMMILPLAATTTAQWLQAIGLALIVCAAHYVWVVRMNYSFEEAAIEAGVRRAARVEAMRQGRRMTPLSQRASKGKSLRKPWFPLAETGRPGMAVLWKNFLMFTRNLTFLVPILLLTFPALLGYIGYSEEHTMKAALFMASMPLLILGGILILAGPLLFRLDLRLDLRNIDLLRTLPIRGTELVVAEVGATTSAILLAQVILLGGGWALQLAAGAVPHALLLGILSPLLIIPMFAIDALVVMIHNGFAMLYPAWTRIGPEQPGGVEYLGQNILTMLGTFVLFIIGLLPPLIVGAIAAAATWMQWGQLAAIPGAIAGVAALLGEVFLIALWLGRTYDRLDPVDAGLIRNGS